MLRVFVYLGGSSQNPMEVKARPAGHALAALKDGRKAHFWWAAQDLPEEEAGAASFMRSLVPNVDRLWVGRDLGNGSALLPVFDGMVVEASYDPSMVSVTALEPQRQDPYPPVAVNGGAREVLRPVPAAAPEAPSAPVAAPGHGTGAPAMFQVRREGMPVESGLHPV